MTSLGWNVGFDSRTSFNSGESDLVFLIPVSSAIFQTLQALRRARILQSVERDLNLLVERIGS
jgi:hypothetical protein